MANLLVDWKMAAADNHLSVTAHLHALPVDGSAPIRYTKINFNVYLCMLPLKIGGGIARAHGRADRQNPKSRSISTKSPQTVAVIGSDDRKAPRMPAKTGSLVGGLSTTRRMRRGHWRSNASPICAIYIAYRPKLCAYSNIIAYRLSPRARKLCQTGYRPTRFPTHRARHIAPSPDAARGKKPPPRMAKSRRYGSDPCPLMGRFVDKVAGQLSHDVGMGVFSRRS